MENASPDRLLKLQTALSLRRHEGIKKALTWYRENPQELSKRTYEFDKVLSSLRTHLWDPKTDQKKYQHAAELKSLLADQELPPSLKITAELSQTNPREHLMETVQKTFDEVRDMLSNEWSWAGDLNPQQTASGLLIEGFGLMTEKYLDKPGLRKPFVYAFEEELILNHKDSSILKDVIGWMQEEKSQFSPVVQAEIDKVPTHS